MRSFGKFFAIFLAAAHISTVNCDKMTGNRPKQPAYEIFSIKRRFNSPSSDLLCSRRPAHSAQVGVKYSYPL